MARSLCRALSFCRTKDSAKGGISVFSGLVNVYKKFILLKSIHLCAFWFVPMGWLKGNPVKIRNSSRCCNPHFKATALSHCLFGKALFAREVRRPANSQCSMLSGRKAMNRKGQYTGFWCLLLGIHLPCFLILISRFIENDAATFNHSIHFLVFWEESFCSKNHDGFCASNQSSWSFRQSSFLLKSGIK